MEDKAAAAIEGNVQEFFPRGCFYFWDGQGEMPLGSTIVAAAAGTLEQACRGCVVESCNVRVAPQERLSDEDLLVARYRLSF